MIHIVKQNEPEELKALRASGSVEYKDLKDDAKKAVAESLLQEQGYLCAYCMRQINYLGSIEHHHPQSIYDGTNGKEDLRLSYQNFLGVCVGFYESYPNPNTYHCEKVRGNTPLKVNPQDINTIAALKYTNNGKIFSDDEDIKRDVTETLQLNVEILRQKRLQVWDGVQKGLSLSIRGKTPQNIQQQFDKYSNRKDGKRFEYCGIVLYFLQKELHRLNNQ